MGHVVKKIEGTEPNLMPCPFCGGTPGWIAVPGDDSIMRCAVCHASTRKARMSPEAAAADWNALEIEDSNCTVADDIRIEEYLKGGIKKILFSEYSNVNPYPTTDGGFLCSEAVIETEDRILQLEPEGTFLFYDESGSYNPVIYRKLISAEGETVQFRKCRWKDGDLLSVDFSCGERTVTVSASDEYDCLIVREQ